MAEFADRAKSAATIIGRDGLEELLVAIESGAVDVLVCEDLSRLSRSQHEVALLYASSPSMASNCTRSLKGR